MFDDLDSLFDEVPENHKMCNTCSTIKSFEAFSIDKGRKTGRFSRCKECCSTVYKQNLPKIKEKLAEYYAKNVETIKKQRKAYRQANKARLTAEHKAWRKRKPEFFKNAVLMRTYGITLEQFKSMIEKQNGKCDCCNTALDMGKNTHVDHDHVTGKVRGILCVNCNVRVGVYEKHSNTIEKYLTKYNHQSEIFDIRIYIPTSAFLN